MVTVHNCAGCEAVTWTTRYDYDYGQVPKDWREITTAQNVKLEFCGKHEITVTVKYKPTNEKGRQARWYQVTVDGEVWK
jgi:hypothetical protein